MGNAAQHFLPRERLPAVSLHFTVPPRKVLSLRIAADSELRVQHQRVWLTCLGSPLDHWLQPGESIRLQRRERIWLSTDANAAAEVSLTSAFERRLAFVARWPHHVVSLVFRALAPLPRRL
jgi:hypothetical protein